MSSGCSPDAPVDCSVSLCVSHEKRGRMKLKTVCLAALLLAGPSALVSAQTQPTTAKKATAARKKKAAVHHAAATPRPAVAATASRSTLVSTVAKPGARPVKKRGWVQTWDEPTF